LIGAFRLGRDLDALLREGLAWATSVTEADGT
jgi:hypothetical protein